MVSTFTANKRLEEPANGDYVDTWDVPMNANSTAIDVALGGSTLLNATGLGGGVNVVLTSTQYRPLSLLVSGLPIAGGVVYCIPSGVGGQWVFYNGTTGGFPVSFRSNAGGPIITVPGGVSTLFSCDGSASGMRYSVSSATATAAGAATQIQFNTAGSLAASANLTFNGTTLRATGLDVAGNSTIGANSASTTTINGTAVAIPNGINFGTNKLFVSGSAARVGIGTTAVGTNALTAVGIIQSTTGGFKFPDNSVQTTAAGTGGAAGSSTWVQYNNAGAFAGSANFTFNGTVVTAASLVLSTTPLAVTSGGTGVTTSTGTGATVRGTTPTIATPIVTGGTFDSPAMSGTPTAPTAALGTSTTQVATTAFASRVGVQQLVSSFVSAYSATAGNGITADNTIPLITEGDQILSRAITPVSVTSKLLIEVTAIIARVGTDTVTLALFQDATANAIAAVPQTITGNTAAQITLRWVMTSGTTSATTFTVRVGSNTPAVLDFNGAGSAGLLGGAIPSGITITEIGA